MKKSLFALAAVTAFAGAAQAQSSVTVYGILDVGYVGGNERLSGDTTTFNNQGVKKQNQNGFGQSAQSTSRLGFRGTEDLGGGMAAFFTLEMQVNPDGAGTSSPLANNRAAFVGLSQKGIGQASMGLQNTVVTDAMSPTLTGQFNNIVGSLMFPGATSNTGAASNNANNYFQANSADGNQAAFTFRTSNTLKAQTERMAGLQVGAMLVLNDETDTQTTARSTAAGATTTTVLGGKNNQNGWGVGLNYQWQKLIVTGAYQSLRANNPYVAVTNNTTGNTVVNNTAAFNASGAGTNVNDNQAYVGATYDFGILKAYASWINRKVTSTVAGNNYAKRTAQEIGVRGNWTPKIESWASAGNGRVTTFGINEPTANLVGWQVGSNYILSKRTNLYAIYGQSGTSNVSNAATGQNQSYNANNYALGVRHTF
jgi:predicted porin